MTCKGRDRQAADPILPLPPGEGRGEGELKKGLRKSKGISRFPSPQPPPGGRGRNAIPWIAVAVLFSCCSLACAENWPQWRGPRLDGTSTETNVPTHWAPGENIKWKTAIPGKGHSSPIVWGDRIFVTTCVENKQQRMLICLERNSGKVLWQKQVLKSPLEHKNQLNSYASATPATDGKHVYVAFFQIPKIELACYDFDGNEVWRKSPGEFFSVHGFCSSPILYKDLVILNCDQDSPAACIVAYNKDSGEERWRTERPNRTRSYCTPIIHELAGKEQLVLSGSKCVASYDPDNGRQLWIMDGPTEQFVASPVVTDGVVFVTGGFPTYHLVVINPDGTGNISSSKVLWHEHGSVASYVPSPIAAGDWFFVVSDGGLASCWETKTGKMLWKRHLGQHHSASAVSAGENLYFIADNGDTFVVKAHSKFELVSQNPLGEEVRASPAIAQGDIYIRGSEHLFCIAPTAREK